MLTGGHLGVDLVEVGDALFAVLDRSRPGVIERYGFRRCSTTHPLDILRI